MCVEPGLSSNVVRLPVVLVSSRSISAEKLPDRAGNDGTRGLRGKRLRREALEVEDLEVPAPVLPQPRLREVDEGTAEIPGVVALGHGHAALLFPRAGRLEQVPAALVQEGRYEQPVRREHA